jgi:hypothetical protein
VRRMIRRPLRQTFAALTLCCVSCFFGWGNGPGHAQALILRSTGPSAARYPVGMRLPREAEIVLRPSDRLQVLFRHRDTTVSRTFSGPSTFRLTNPPPVVQAIATSRARAGVAGVRGGGYLMAGFAPDPWIDEVTIERDRRDRTPVCGFGEYLSPQTVISYSAGKYPLIISATSTEDLVMTVESPVRSCAMR